MSQTQNEIKFLHFRDIDLFDGVNPRGGVTISFYPFEDDGTPKQVVYAAARCSEDDNFNKATGRTLAAERLLAGDVGLVSPVYSEKEFAAVLENYLYTNFGYIRKFSRKRRSR